MAVRDVRPTHRCASGGPDDKGLRKVKGRAFRPSLSVASPTPRGNSCAHRRRASAPCQPRSGLNANAANARTMRLSTPLRHIACSVCRAIAEVPAICPAGGRNRAPKRDGGTSGANNETPVQSRAVRLLERAPRQPSGAGARRHRTERNSPGARRHLRARDRCHGPLSIPPRRHEALRAVRPRAQERELR